MSKLKIIARATKYTAFAVLFSIALSGCSLFSSKTATDPDINRIVVWGFENPDAWKPIKQEFQNDNKGITLDYQQQTFDENYENRVLNSILSTRKPDVWAMPNDWVYRHKDKLYPMPAKQAATLKIDDEFVPSIKQSVDFDNNIYALSPSDEPLIMYYNPEIFSSRLNELTQNSKDEAYIQKVQTLLAEPPKTWTDLTAAANLLTKKTGSTINLSGLALGTTKIRNSQDILYLMMMQNETKILSENYQLATFNLPVKTSVGNNDTPGKRALDFYTSFANPNSPNYSWNDSLGDEVEAFANQKVAMIFGYSGLQNYILQKYPDLSFTYRKTYVPQVNQENANIVDFARFTAFGVSAFTKNPTASWNLVSKVSTDLANNLTSYNRTYSSAKASNYDISITSRTPGNPERLALATANSLVKGRYPLDFDNIIRTMINNVNSGTLDSQTAIDLAANNITEMLRKESW
jgi:ABC-type glycerol-3-phosphate transport system substrate-binding protein